MGWSSWLLFVLFFVIHSYQPLSSSALLSPSSPLCHPSESSALLGFSNSFSINQHIDYHMFIWGDTYPKTVSWKNETDCSAVSYYFRACNWP